MTRIQLMARKDVDPIAAGWRLRRSTNGAGALLRECERQHQRDAHIVEMRVWFMRLPFPMLHSEGRSFGVGRAVPPSDVSIGAVTSQRVVM